MARLSKTRINETLGDFLFEKIRTDESYLKWADTFEIPQYIVGNLTPQKKLREYQIAAIKHFIYLYENGNEAEAKHNLFNMATGTGKTLVMAACILYLYEKGCRNFIFLVHQVQILEQARKNLTDYTFEKYLFNPIGINFNGRKIKVKEILRPQDSSPNDINIMFLSTSLLYNRLKEASENGLIREDFTNNRFVVIADEAHRLNVETRNTKSSAEEEEVLNWESAVMGAVNARSDNMLIEFTATVDLANEKIHAKYKDKIIYKYDFLSFNKDGYSKDVKFLYNYETQIEDQKKFLIVNAVALSQYRKMLFRHFAKTEVNPVVLIKSKRIADSVEDRDYFNRIISGLRPTDLSKLKETKQDDFHLVGNMFAWLANNKITIEEFIAEIKQDFSEDNTLIYNSQKKERADLLSELDSPRNTVRAIFSVNALNEGWDVLGLFDIIHFDISETKKVSLQDIQLIGRGARYCPFELPKNRGEDNLFGSYETNAYKRKFDSMPYETERILETFFYHFVRTGTFMDKLQEELLGEGIINEGVEKKTIRMKPEFLASDTYKKGFVLVNSTEKRERTTLKDTENTFKRALNASSYQLRARGLTDSEQSKQISTSTKLINITIDFSDQVVYKALMRAENGFFRFANLKEHIVDLDSIDEFINKYLSLYKIKYTYEAGKDIWELSAEEKLQLLVGVILPEIRKLIDIHLPKIVGSRVFKPVSIERVFEKEKNIYFTSFPVTDEITGAKKFLSTDERFKPQTNHENPAISLNISEQNWYAYDENYATGEEKKFVKYIAKKIELLKKKYEGSEIYLLRNELDYWLFSPQDGRRFSPDYLLFINDVKNRKLYYQCIIEVKGGHLIDKDQWKEDALVSLNEGTEIAFKFDEDDQGARHHKQAYKDYLQEVEKMGYKEIKNIGLEFYNTDPRDESDFDLKFEERILV